MPPYCPLRSSTSRSGSRLLPRRVLVYGRSKLASVVAAQYSHHSWSKVRAIRISARERTKCHLCMSTRCRSAIEGCLVPCGNLHHKTRLIVVLVPFGEVVVRVVIERATSVRLPSHGALGPGRIRREERRRDTGIRLELLSGVETVDTLQSCGHGIDAHDL